MTSPRLMRLTGRHATAFIAAAEHLHALIARSEIVGFHGGYQKMLGLQGIIPIIFF